MRRLILAVLAVAALAAPASAQQLIGPGGVIFASDASVTVTNSATAAPLFTYTVPASYMQPVVTNPGLHLKLMGTVSTATGVGQVGNVNASCDWGGSASSGSPSGVASAALLNGAIFPNSLSSVPIIIDLYLKPLNPFDASRTQFMLARFASSSSTSESSFDLASVTAVNAGVNNTLRCTWQWASANTSNSVTIYNAVLNVGP